MINSATSLGRVSWITLIKLSIERENLPATTAIIANKGIIETNKKKASCPGKIGSIIFSVGE